MPRLLSNVNSTGAVGISSDGSSLGNMTDLNFESNRVKFDRMLEWQPFIQTL